MQTELLSPAGDIEAAYSAFYFGADAVYLGLRQFSARAEAVNFTPAELDEITAYAHSIGKRYTWPLIRLCKNPNYRRC